MRMFIVASLQVIALSALPLAASEDKPVLQVTGAVANAPVSFSMTQIQNMPATTLTTSTVVTDGVHHFTGVLLRDFLAELEAVGETITATALNDYIVDIPFADFEEFDVIVAYSMDGEALDRADKGPLWIVYPRDAHAELQDIRYDYRWVWQLMEIEVK
ncbi:molybdopterin-dependent oxidoreductase [Celeribacter sp.]|uniref:molybdopterin-dependent oxidoreductase n=1 Tax=Celeribacter sp. TaxID=1890673 RepID=UPI003A93F470